MLQVSVIDTSPGISLADQAELFQFTGLNREHKKMNGLCLPIAKKIIE